MSVKVSGLTKQYGTQLAVNNVDFEVNKGTILGFLGPNGAGKTTTMKMITSFIKPSSGTVEVCDIDVLENPIEARKHIGYLPEHNPLYKEMYVLEYLEFVASLHKLKRAGNRIENLVEMTGLGREQHKKIGQLSKGFRQRVGLAQAMMHDPEVLILDEPTSGLDPNQLKEIRVLISELGKDKTLIFSSHILQEVEALCDRALVINKGKIVADDSIDSLQHIVQNDQVITLELKKAIDEKVFNRIKGVKKTKTLKAGLYEIICQQGTDVRAEIFNSVVQQDGIILGMSRKESTMEDVFQILTKSNSE